MWFIRVVELDDGTWECRRGLTSVDRHETLGEATDHSSEMAAMIPPSRVIVHAWDSDPIVAAEFL